MINIQDFIKWLKVHKLGVNLRYDELKREHDLGYLKACEVIESELMELIDDKNRL